MQAINFVLVPYPVPVGNGVGWEKRAKPRRARQFPRPTTARCGR
jgi:hypothetical protein